MGGMDCLKRGATLNLGGAVSHQCLRNAGILRGLSDDFMTQLFMEMSVQIFSTEEDIMKEGTVADKLYYLNRGDVDILVGGAARVKIASLSSGSMIGEMGLFNAVAGGSGGRRTATIQAKSYCDCRVVRYEAFMALLNRFPKERAAFEQLARQRQVQLDKSRSRAQKAGRLGPQLQELQDSQPQSPPASTKSLPPPDFQIMKTQPPFTQRPFLKQDLDAASLQTPRVHSPVEAQTRALERTMYPVMGAQDSARSWEAESTKAIDRTKASQDPTLTTRTRTQTTSSPICALPEISPRKPGPETPGKAKALSSQPLPPVEGKRAKRLNEPSSMSLHQRLPAAQLLREALSAMPSLPPAICRPSHIVFLC